jgi:hypothetical protein
VDRIPSFPHVAATLDHSNNFRRYALRITAFATAHVPPFRGGRQNPLHRRASSLPLAKRNWELQSYTTTCRALLATDAQKWGY